MRIAILGNSGSGKPTLAWVHEYYTRDGEMSFREHQALFAAYEGQKEHLSRLPDLDPAARATPWWAE